jgi:hypothetical protein
MEKTTVDGLLVEPWKNQQVAGLPVWASKLGSSGACG